MMEICGFFFIVVAAIAMIIDEREAKRKGYRRRPSRDSSNFLAQMFILDAAEEGWFFPGGEQVFMQSSQAEPDEHDYDWDCDWDDGPAYYDDGEDEYWSGMWM